MISFLKNTVKLYEKLVSSRYQLLLTKLVTVQSQSNCKVFRMTRRTQYVLPIHIAQYLTQ
jgi:hypothetical protein